MIQNKEEKIRLFKEVVQTDCGDCSKCIFEDDPKTCRLYYTMNFLYEKSKQEVAREILNELRQEINDALECNQKRLKESEWVYDIVDRIGGKIDVLRGIDGFIDELEEKYFGKDTESEDING